MNEPQYVDGWRIDTGPDGVAASHPNCGTIVILASGKIMSGGCEVPGEIVQVLRTELAKMAKVH